ncbi:hypothetical protein HWV62_45134 [Athelia sp. TMB]|nr:hypothetical protein HWV62_45134 [Athelia sp. TMB]
MSLPQTGIDVDEEKDWKHFPLLASYVTIKLDPVKSVEVLDDDEATAAARDAVSKVYVGYTALFGGHPDTEHTSYHMRLLRSGRHKASPEEFIDEDMCIPVFPNADHPFREPLVLSAPLPVGWTNCYHASFDQVTICVERKMGKYPEPVNLPNETWGKHTAAVNQDHRRRAEQMRVLQEVSSAPRAGSHGSVLSISTCEMKSTVYGSTHSSVSLNSLDDNDASKPVPPPIAVVSYDLAAVPALEDPQGLIAEVKFIETVYREARVRAAARRAHAKAETARAIEAARRLDDATYGRFLKRSSVFRAEDAAAPQAELPDSGPSTQGYPIHAVAPISGTYPFWASPLKFTSATWNWASFLCCCKRARGEDMAKAGERHRPRSGAAVLEPPR